jgi:hypothetical protein
MGSPKLSAALQRLDLVDEYRFVVHPVVAGHGPFSAWLAKGIVDRPPRDATIRRTAARFVGTDVGRLMEMSKILGKSAVFESLRLRHLSH